MPVLLSYHQENGGRGKEEKKTEVRKYWVCEEVKERGGKEAEIEDQQVLSLCKQTALQSQAQSLPSLTTSSLTVIKLYGAVPPNWQSSLPSVVSLGDFGA